MDLQFAGSVAESKLLEFRELANGSLGEASPIRRLSTHVLAGQNRITPRPAEQAFWGWEFTTEAPNRVVTVSADQITQYFVRSEGWPAGEYPGWEVISQSYRELWSAAKAAFDPLSIRRAGLRYINRIAVPSASKLEEWFSVAPGPMKGLSGLWNFGVSRTWERADGFPGLSATVTLRSAPDGPRTGDADVTDVILDIDVFNLWVNDAPTLGEVPAWLNKAHDLENRIFETCISSELSSLFGPVDDSR